MGSESVSLMFTESWLDAPGPSRCTCVLPAWTSAARVPKDTTLSTDDHDGKMKTRWSKALLTGRNRSVARAARLSATLAHSNQPPVHIAPHHHLCSVTVPLTSTSDVSLKNDSSEVDIWDTTDEECCTRPDEVSHLDTLELKSGHLNNGSSSHQVRSSCAPSYLVFAAEQSTRVRDEVAKRPEALVFGVFEDGQEAPLFQDDVLHDMVALNSPEYSDIADSYPSLLFGSGDTFEYEDFSPYDNCPSEKDLLRTLRVNRHNLILDSPDPSHVPHIVITPPDAPYDGLSAYLQNGVEWQDGAYLWVPSRVEGYGSIWVPTPWDRYHSWPQARIDEAAKAPCPWRTQLYPYPDSVIEQPPPLDGNHVFSRSAFEEEIESASTERLIMYHVIPALHRKLFKVVALQASQVAAEFRRNWDTPQYIASLEQPFKWMDPAESLLSYHRNQPRSLILDSTKPFSVPHIIIEEAELQDPYMAFANCIPSPQDYAFGQLLTIPAKGVSFINDDPDDYGAEDFLGQVIFAGTSDIENSVPELCPDQGSSSSESESPTSPSTPLDPSESWLDDTIYTHDVVECTDIPHPSLFTEPDIYCHRSESDYDLDEDEDDLPPFDDWYTDIARRSTV